MRKARFRFSTEIVRRLGEELNPSLDKGVIELVKNAFDADATECRIELIKADRPGGSVVVSDDGDGMTVDEIVNGWLVLGKSSKSSGIPTNKGRVPAGSKGLGRLAALRMGKRALLTTRPRSEHSSEHTLLLDWETFDNVSTVDDIDFTVDSSISEEKIKPGTQIIVEELSTSFSRNSVKQLARELILLADPFNDNPTGFNPVLLAPDYKDLENLVRVRYFQDAEYHLRAELDAEGKASAFVKDWKGKDLFTATHDTIAIQRNKKPYGSLAATFDLWVFILDHQVFSTRKSTVKEVRAWLGAFGGVHFYYNGLRISPYGSQGNDWLGMNLRRVRSPEERPSTNTSIGRIDVTDVSNDLIQKTDRSGFIEDEAFSEIRSFAQDAMQWMATRRMAIAENRRIKARTSAPTESHEAKRNLEELIEEVPIESRTKIKNAFNTYDVYRNREVGHLKKEIQLYRTLSTAGITAVTFAHEASGNPLKVISNSINAISHRTKKQFGELYEKSVSNPIESIKRALKSLSVLGSAILKLVDHEKRRVSRVDLHQLLKESLATYQPFLKGRDVNLQLDIDSRSPFLQGSEAAIESIVSNLLNNCLAAFEYGGTQNRIIKITTQVSDAYWTMAIEDNGPGFEGISKADIWLPGRTTRKNGTGLGLTIVRDAVKDQGGKAVAYDSVNLGGALITVELPILGE